MELPGMHPKYEEDPAGEKCLNSAHVMNFSSKRQMTPADDANSSDISD
jgi:hypothetical protein